MTDDELERIAEQIWAQSSRTPVRPLPTGLLAALEQARCVRPCACTACGTSNAECNRLIGTACITCCPACRMDGDTHASPLPPFEIPDFL